MLSNGFSDIHGSLLSLRDNIYLVFRFIWMLRKHLQSKRFKRDLLISKVPISLSSLLHICKWHHPNSAFHAKSCLSLPNSYPIHYQILSVCLQNIFWTYQLLNPPTTTMTNSCKSLTFKATITSFSLVCLHCGTKKSIRTESKWFFYF